MGSIIVNHSQLISLTNFVKDIKEIVTKDGNQDAIRIITECEKYFSPRLLESDFVYSLTLKYPQTEIDRAYINAIIKNFMPSVEQLTKHLEDAKLI